LENALVLIRDGAFAEVGMTGEVRRPDAPRVDLRGKTIIPALVNVHVHLGYDRGESFSADNFTQDHLVSQLERYAYAGVRP
jgi:imidazolonepropionase-like amidohydrolase